jgi:hypothetical protein
MPAQRSRDPPLRAADRTAATNGSSLRRALLGRSSKGRIASLGCVLGRVSVRRISGAAGGSNLANWDERAGQGQSGCCDASSTARSTARAFASLSANS